MSKTTMPFFLGGGITAFIIVVMIGTHVAPHARIPNVVWLFVFIGGGAIGLFITTACSRIAHPGGFANGEAERSTQGGSMSTLLHKSGVKGIRQDGQTLESAKAKGFSLRWAGARRGFLKVYEDAIECGDWRIPFSEIKQAELVSFPYFFTRGYLLRVQTASELYQFGVSPSRFWKGNIPFPASTSKYAGPAVIFAQVLRIAVLIWIQTFPPVGIPYLLYVIWLHFRK